MLSMVSYYCENIRKSGDSNNFSTVIVTWQDSDCQGTRKSIFKNICRPLCHSEEQSDEESLHLCRFCDKEPYHDRHI